MANGGSITIQVSGAVIDLLKEIKSQNQLIIEQNHYLIGRAHKMATDVERLQSDLDTLKSDNTTLADALTSISAKINQLAANQTDPAQAAKLTALADEADQIVTDAAANVSSATALNPPTEPPATPPTP